MNTFNEYQMAVTETAVYPGPGTLNGLAYVTLGLAGEAGELANKVKKAYRDDGEELTPLRKAELKKELGDVLWYASQMATELGILLADVAADNLDRLQSRKQRGTLHGSGDNR